MAYTGSKAQSGRGSAISIGAVSGGTGSGETFTLIGEVSESGISGNAWGTEDSTNFQSGADEEFLSTVRNNGEVGMVVNRVSSDAGQIALETAYQSGNKYDFQIVLPKLASQVTSGDMYAFSALVMSREIAIGVKKKVELTVKLKISGAVVLTVGA